MLTKIPDVFVIVFSLILLAAVLTWVIPGGSYEREERVVEGVTRLVVKQDSFSPTEAQPQLLEVFAAPMKGFLRPVVSSIVVFIFLVGGAFNILHETGAVAAGLAKLVRAVKGHEYLVIPIVMTFFSFFGAVFGMCEEAIPFVLILVPLALALGYDSLVGVSLSFLAAGVGFAGAFINPFTLQIAQGLAGVPLLSGMGYRIVVWCLSTSLAIVWVMVYAARIKADPTKSPMYELDQQRRRELALQQQDLGELTLRQALCLLVLGVTIVVMIAGVVLYGWYITEIAALFFAMGIIGGLVAGMGPNALAKAFVKGCRDIVGAALIVAFAAGILVILEDGKIMDTVLHTMATAAASLPSVASAQVMYLFQMVINLFVPSGSAQAALTVPIMSHLADFSGVTRQTAVLAFQLGDGFTNMIIPTSGVTVGTLGLAKIPYERWARFHLPMQGAFFVLSLLLLIWPVLTRWQ